MDLKGDIKSQLLEKHFLSSNLGALNAPLVNPEIYLTMSAYTLKDKYQVGFQNQLEVVAYLL